MEAGVAADRDGVVAPASPRELTDPRWRGQIASAYPNDDDASLFLFKRYAETYGWSWIADLAEQQLSFARGSRTPGVAVAEGRKAIGVGGSGVRGRRAGPGGSFRPGTPSWPGDHAPRSSPRPGTSPLPSSI